MHLRRLLCVFAGAIATLVVTAATSVAAVTTIGVSDLTTFAIGPNLNGAHIDETVPAGDVLAAPADGRLVRWRINVSGPSTWRLFVLHPTGAPNTYLATAADDQVSTAAGINAFTPATPLTISAGDRIAIVRVAGSSTPRYLPSIQGRRSAGAPVVGATTTFTATNPSGGVLMNADVVSDDPSAVGGVSRPVVGGLTVGRGSTSGGETLTIAGENFTDGSQVLFGDVSASSVTVERFDRIGAVAPPHASGTVPIRVVTPFGISPVLEAGAYVYQ